MSRNPHSEFLKYHGFTEVDAPRKEETDMQELWEEWTSSLEMSIQAQGQNDLQIMP